MPLLPHIRSFIRNLRDPAAADRELDQELDSVADLLVDEKLRDGMDPAEARRRAGLEMGSKESIKARVREERIGQAFATFLQDMRYGGRMARKSPGFTLIIVVTLALGIGGTTATFSVVDRVLLRSLPYPGSDRLVYVSTTGKETSHFFSPPDFLDFRDQTSSFQEIGAIHGLASATFSADGRPENVQREFVTPNFLSLYGLEPYAGRTFVATDDVPVPFEDWGNPAVTLPTSVVMISYEFWRHRFGRDPAVLGKLIQLDSYPYEIIGITPPNFHALFPGNDYTRKVQVWSLSQMDFRRMPRDTAFLRVIGRLKPGVSIEQARAEASSFVERQRALFPMHRETGYGLELTSLHQSVAEAPSESILILFAAVGFVLLIACANLTNLLLARSAGRQKEFAVRMALGSGRVRLVRQLLTESLLYSVLGTGAGLLVAKELMDAFIQWSPASIPRMEEIHIDAPVLAFALGTTLVTTLLVGLLPAMRLSTPQVSEELRTAGRGTVGFGPRHWDGLLVIGEVALSVILVIGTALLLLSLVTLLKVDPGFRPANVLTAEMNLSSRRYPRYPRPDARVRFARQVSERVSRLPGVQVVGLALVVPLSAQDTGHSYATEQIAATRRVFPPAKYRPVTPGYFRAVGTRLLAGRSFTWADLNEERLVSIVDEKLARKAWPGENPVGKRLRIEVWSTARTGQIHLEPLWTEVIGVAENARSVHLGEEDLETLYIPYNLYAVSELSLLVRSASDPTRLTDLIRHEIRQVDGDLAVFHFRLMEDYVSDSVAPQRFSATLLSAFGLCGLGLALIGLYGVLSHSVSLRLREISIRIAMGALPGDVLRLVMRRGVRWTGMGLGLGLAAAWVLARLLQSQLYGVSPSDLPVYAGVAALTLLVSLVACYLPARRATKVDPIAMLRVE